MTATVMIPIRPTSHRRAAAARANGARSRGPVTAQGKANSSRNSRRHGLRSRIPLFTDPASQAELAANRAAFELAFDPQSSIERKLVNTLAVADWQRTCLFKLEMVLFNQETAGLAPVFAVYRLDRRYERQFTASYKALTEHRAFLRESAAPRNPEQLEMTERTQQVIETTGAPCATNPETAGYPPLDRNSEKAKVNQRTQQVTENKSGGPVGTFPGPNINPTDTAYQSCVR